MWTRWWCRVRPFADGRETRDMGETPRRLVLDHAGRADNVGVVVLESSWIGFQGRRHAPSRGPRYLGLPAERRRDAPAGHGIALDHAELAQAGLAAARKLLDERGRITLLTALEEVPGPVAGYVGITPPRPVARPCGQGNGRG